MLLGLTPGSATSAEGSGLHRTVLERLQELPTATQHHFKLEKALSCFAGISSHTLWNKDEYFGVEHWGEGRTKGLELCW